MATEVVSQRAREWYGLTERQAALAGEYVENGGNMKAAARVVGYDYREAKRLLAEHPRFQAAVHEFVRYMAVRDVVRARAVALEIMENASSDKVRLEAAKMLWERGAGKPVQPVQPMDDRPERQMSRQELREAIREIAKELGFSVKPDGKVIDLVPEPAEEPHGGSHELTAGVRAPAPHEETADAGGEAADAAEALRAPASHPEFVGTLRAPSAEPDEYVPPLPEDL